MQHDYENRQESDINRGMGRERSEERGRWSSQREPHEGRGYGENRGERGGGFEPRRSSQFDSEDRDYGGRWEGRSGQRDFGQQPRGEYGQEEYGGRGFQRSQGRDIHEREDRSGPEYRGSDYRGYGYGGGYGSRQGGYSGSEVGGRQSGWGGRYSGPDYGSQGRGYGGSSMYEGRGYGSEYDFEGRGGYESRGGYEQEPGLNRGPGYTGGGGPGTGPEFRDWQIRGWGQGQGQGRGMSQGQGQSRGWGSNIGMSPSRGWQQSESSGGGYSSIYDQERNRGQMGMGGSQAGALGTQQGHSFRGRGPKGYSRSDDTIRDDVCERLEDDDQLDPGEVTVEVVAGEVKLTGSVDSRWAKRKAEDLAYDVRGVKNVQNQLSIEESSERGASEQQQQQQQGVRSEQGNGQRRSRSSIRGTESQTQEL